MAIAIQGLNDVFQAGRPKDVVDEGWRRARGALADARHASEDAVAESVVRIRRRPLAAVGGAAAIGLVVGTVFGLVVFSARTAYWRARGNPYGD